MLIVHNSTRSPLYLDAETGGLLTFNQAKENIAPRPEDYSNFITHGIFYASGPGKYWPIGGKFLIPPRTKWIWHDGQIEYLREQGIESRVTRPSKQRLLEAIRRYVNVLSGKRIAVELSGGLDATLVFRLLLHAGIEPSLIGFVSDRYEFRTERSIQRTLAQETSCCELLHEADHSLFSNLGKIPPHPIPSPSSLFHERHSRIAIAARQFRADIVLTGLGGDSIFIEKIPKLGPFPLNTISGWTFQDYWSQDAIYSVQGIHHYCAYSLREIQRILLTMRAGHPEDRMKLWARGLFESHLPQELSRYAYKASHSGMYSEALQGQSSYILNIMREVFEATGIQAFRPRENKDILDNWPNVKQQRQQLFFSNLSFCVWFAAASR